MGSKVIRNITKVFRATSGRLFGRVTSGTGPGEELTPAQVRTLIEFDESVDDRVAALLQAGTNISITYNDVANTLTIASSGGGGTGDVVGPSSATDNAIARYDATTGKLIQNSSATITDNGSLVATTSDYTHKFISTYNSTATFDTANVISIRHTGTNGASAIAFQRNTDGIEMGAVGSLTITGSYLTNSVYLAAGKYNSSGVMPVEAPPKVIIGQEGYNGGSQLAIPRVTCDTDWTIKFHDVAGVARTTMASGGGWTFTQAVAMSSTVTMSSTVNVTSSVMTVGGTDTRGVLTVMKSDTTTYAADTDMGDPGRMFVMQNTSTSNVANQFANITLQVNPTGSLSGGRVLGDFRLIRETANNTNSFFLLSAFRQGASYKDFARIGFDYAQFAGSIRAGAGISAAATTFSVLNATAATATLGFYRITDRGNKLAYPDGTNWRFVGDDAIIS